MEAIEVKGLTKQFGKLKKTTVVNDLSMKIETGSVHGFIGPNGAGKTTTIKMLMGVILPTKGDILINGNKAGTISAKKLIGYSPEHPDFYNMPAKEFLIYCAEICGVKNSEKRAEELLNWMGLLDFKNVDARKFSSGMKQKLSLAQALIHDPEILILDEPTSNLDPLGRHEVLAKIKDLSIKEKKTIFVSSHILDELEKIIDHVTVLKKGNVLLQTSVDGLKEKYGSNHYFLNTKNNPKYLQLIKKIKNVKSANINHEHKIELITNPGFKKDILKLFSGKEEDLLEFSPFRMSLENLFMKLVK